MPPWITIEHDGLVARWGPTRQHRFGCGCIWMLAPLWSAIIVAGLVTDGVSGSWCLMAAMALFLWPLAFGMLLTLTDRYLVRISPGELAFTRWRWGIRSRQKVALAGASVKGHVHEGGKGWTNCALEVTPPDGKALHVVLPGGHDLGDRAQAIANLRWVEETVAEIAEAAPSPTEPDEAARARVLALMRSRAERV